MPQHDSWNERLAGILTEFGCQTGTLHRTMQDAKTLSLVCQSGVPDFLLDIFENNPPCDD